MVAEVKSNTNTDIPAGPGAKVITSGFNQNYQLTIGSGTASHASARPLVFSSSSEAESFIRCHFSAHEGTWRSLLRLEFPEFATQLHDTYYLSKCIAKLLVRQRIRLHALPKLEKSLVAQNGKGKAYRFVPGPSPLPSEDAQPMHFADDYSIDALLSSVKADDGFWASVLEESGAYPKGEHIRAGEHKLKVKQKLKSGELCAYEFAYAPPTPKRTGFSEVPVSAADRAVPLAPVTEEDPLQWIEVILVDGKGEALPKTAYTIWDAEGGEHSGKTDNAGKARIESLKRGNCDVSFPELKGWMEVTKNEHTVAQGETLNRIAKKYELADGETLYNHEANSALRELRANPDILFPGDKVNIPAIPQKIETRFTGESYEFVHEEAVDKLRLQVGNRSGEPWTGKRIVLNLGGKQVEGEVDSSGMAEFELPDEGEMGGDIEVYMDDSNKPTFNLKVGVGNLDPVEQLSGVQARCNALGFLCGVADGLMGRNTRRGVKAFQSAHGLDVDGVPGPMTKGKLKEVYGC